MQSIRPGFGSKASGWFSATLYVGVIYLLTSICVLVPSFFSDVSLLNQLAGTHAMNHPHIENVISLLLYSLASAMLVGGIRHKVMQWLTANRDKRYRAVYRLLLFVTGVGFVIIAVLVLNPTTDYMLEQHQMEFSAKYATVALVCGLLLMIDGEQIVHKRFRKIDGDRATTNKQG